MARACYDWPSPRRAWHDARLRAELEHRQRPARFVRDRRRGSRDVRRSIDPMHAIRDRIGMRLRVYHDADLLYTLAQGSISVGATNQFNILHTIGAGAGQDATIETQGGANVAGGDLILKSGAAGTGSTSGNVELDARKNAAGTRTGPVIMKGNTRRLLSSRTMSATTSRRPSFREHNRSRHERTCSRCIKTSRSTRRSDRTVAALESHTLAPTTEPTADERRARFYGQRIPRSKPATNAVRFFARNSKALFPARRRGFHWSRQLEVTTTDAVLTLAYSYAIPAHTIGDIEIVIPRSHNATGIGRAGNWRDRSVRRQRDLDGLNAGSPAVRRDVDIHRRQSAAVVASFEVKVRASTQNGEINSSSSR